MKFGFVSRAVISEGIIPSGSRYSNIHAHRTCYGNLFHFCASRRDRNPSVRNLPSWASGRIDKAETGKRTGRKFTCRCYIALTMKEKAKRSPAEGDFLFEIDPQPLEECVTALGGVPLLVRAIRSLDVPGSVQRHLRVKQRERGFDEATYIESFLVLNAVGGDCVEDFEPLREDAGLAAMLGHPVPSAEAARKFLYQFHDEAKIEQAQRELPNGRVSYIPGESAPLRGLAQVNEDVMQELGCLLYTSDAADE